MSKVRLIPFAGEPELGMFRQRRATSDYFHASNALSAMGSSVAHTLAFWIRPEKFTTGIESPVIQMSTTSPTGTFVMSSEFVDESNSKGYLTLYRAWTVFGAWKTNLVMRAELYRCAISYDGASAANVPIMCVNGHDVGAAVLATPSGTRTDGGDSVMVGGSVGGGLADMSTAHVACWSSALSRAECIALSQGRSPLTMSTRPDAYWPLQGTRREVISDLATTVNGSPTFISVRNESEAYPFAGPLTVVPFMFTNHSGMRW